MNLPAAQVEARTVAVPGAELYFEFRGTGPALLCISGGPDDADSFTDLAERLADRYTVVTYDQRGHSRSSLHGEPEDIPVALHAEDAAAILAAIGKGAAFVYGKGRGGTIGLELVARHPRRVRTLVAHEAPIGGNEPHVVVLRTISTRIVSAAGETSDEQTARRAAFALGERLGVPIAYLPGGQGGWGSDPQEFAERLDVVLQGG